MANQPHWNITPVHQALTSFTASSSHTSLTQFANPTNAAFQSMRAFGTNSTHTTTASAGFQYYFTLTIVLSASSQETVSVSDTQIDQITVFQTEGINVIDQASTGIDPVVEQVPISDSQFQNITVFQTEGVAEGEQLQSTGTQEQDVPIGIDQFEYITIQQEEDIAVTDSEVAVPFFNDFSSMKIGVLGFDKSQSSMCVTIDAYDTEMASLTIGIKQSNISPITSLNPIASGSSAPPVIDIVNYNVPVITSPISVTSNPFTPTVILGGVTYSSYSGTAPPDTYDVTANTYFIQYLNAGIGGVDSCSLVNFNMDINRTNGSWSFVTVGDYSFTLGNPISIFGLLGTITGLGSIMSNNQVGTLVSGIFGSRNLNKPLNLIAGGSVTGSKTNVLFAYLTNSNLSVLQENTIPSYAAAAQAIANLAQINLSWQLPNGDIPLVNFTLSEGETALSALSSIATMFGGYLLWDGGVNYTIGPPNTIIGGWAIPSQAVISPSGIQFTETLDLSTGVSGQGIYSIPLTTFRNPGTYDVNSIPTDLTQQKIQKVTSIRQVLGPNDPNYYVDIPLDAEEVWVQLQVTDNTTSGTNSNAVAGFSGSTGDASTWLTTDPLAWVSLGQPGGNNTSVPYVNIGGAVRPQVLVNQGFFPTNSNGVNNGNFILNIGVTRNNQQDLFNAAVNQRNAQITALLAQIQGSIAYIQTYTGTINTYFFGSLPIPGCWTNVTACGTTVQGLVESVNFSFPGILNVQIAQYAQIDYSKNFYSLDFSSTTGVGSSNGSTTGTDVSA